MKKSELRALIREQVKSILKEASYKPSEFDITRNVTTMLNLRDNDVIVSLNSLYNQIKFTIKKDIEEKKFNEVIKYLEDIGYKVDETQSYRQYETEDGKSIYPRIRF